MTAYPAFAVFTANFPPELLGELVPIPTLPEESMRRRSDAPTPKEVKFEEAESLFWMTNPLFLYFTISTVVSPVLAAFCVISREIAPAEEPVLVL